MNQLLKKEVKFIWREKQQKAFEILKEELIKAPVLTYPDFNKQFIIFTNASKRGLGAVLSQLDDEGKERIIIYDSKNLLSAKKNYHTTDLEYLAVIWAV